MNAKRQAVTAISCLVGMWACLAIAFPPDSPSLELKSLTGARPGMACGTMGEGRSGGAWSLYRADGGPFVLSQNLRRALHEEALLKGLRFSRGPYGDRYTLTRGTAFWRDVRYVDVSPDGRVSEGTYTERKWPWR